MEVDNDEAGRILAIRLPHPLLAGQRFAAVRYHYDAQGRLIQALDALDQANGFAYQGRLITARSFPNGGTFTFEYDGQQRCTAALGPEGLYSYRFAYAQGYTKVTNAVGSTSTYYHRGDGLVHRIVDSLGAEQYFHYDDFNRLASQRDALGRVSSYQYDE